jgi:hypothetical protein
VAVLLILVGAVILAGVVGLALGRGGEMAEFASDYASCGLGDPVTASDVALLRPPSALWGYDMQATDEALARISRVITERDIEIAVLRRQLDGLRPPASADLPGGVSLPAAADQTRTDD